MATPIIHKRRHITEKGNILVMVAWKIPVSTFYPEGIKYSFAFIHKNKRIIAFDNFNNEGHHKHYFTKKEKTSFIDIKKTIEDFFIMIEEFEKSE